MSGPLAFCTAGLVAVLLGGPATAAETRVENGLKAILAVTREGGGNESAAAGWKAVVTAGPDALVPTLTAFDSASPTAANWLRSAVDAIAEAQRKAKRPLPADRLLTFLHDTARKPEARRIAFELYSEEHPGEAAKLLPGLIGDPSMEIRREAIAARLKSAGEHPPVEELRALFAAVRDRDQAEDLAKRLGDHGPAPDVTRHFNYLTEWQVAGPFDSPGGTGFGKSFAPEAGVDPGAKYEGKAGSQVTWRYAQSHELFGELDLNEVVGKSMDAVAYAHAVVESTVERPAEIRVASPNAVAIFLNGQKLFEREEYHHGAPFDQYIGRGVLKAGRNEVLIKVVQNNQKDSWAQAWQFSARVCDETGGAIPLTQHIMKDGQPTTVTPGARKPVPKKPTEVKK
jgi:hypothetical protein